MTYPSTSIQKILNQTHFTKLPLYPQKQKCGCTPLKLEIKNNRKAKEKLPITGNKKVSCIKTQEWFPKNFNFFLRKVDLIELYKNTLSTSRNKMV